MKKITLFKSNKLNNTLIPLPGSKSETNRALIINALSDNPGIINNVSQANDSIIMQALLSQEADNYDAQDAGTVMRFMTAYLSVQNNKAVITGTDIMKKRPITVLVDALNTLGAEITYLEESGYPPLKINGLIEQKTDSLEIASDVSSQYISALLMIAPLLPLGLSLRLRGATVSMPYIDMTVSIMQHFGVETDVKDITYKVKPQVYKYAPYTVESDWSAASYWYSIFVLSDLQELRLAGLKQASFQGDNVVAKLMEYFGVITSFDEKGAILNKIEPSLPDELDFVNYPDLAQTFAVLCTALGHNCMFHGLQTLKIKETDRVVALKTELNKLGADLIEDGNSWRLKPIPRDKFQNHGKVTIDTYNDHRMAMAFAPLATRMDVEIDSAEVINKSYPGFWQDMKTLGFEIRY